MASRRQMTIGVVIITILTLVALPGCGADSLGLTTDAHEVRATILEHFPKGTPLPEAKQAMVSHGFACEEHTNGSFFDHASAPPRRHHDIDYITCAKTKRRFAGLYQRTWVIAFVYEDGYDPQVSDVLVRVWRGPPPFAKPGSR